MRINIKDKLVQAGITEGSTADASPTIQAAINQAIVGNRGGTLDWGDLFDIYLKTPITLGTNYCAFYNTSCGGSRIFINGPTHTIFNCYNSQLIQFEKMNFVGMPANGADCDRLVSAAFNFSLIFEKCQFQCLRAANNLVYTSNSRLRMDHCLFGHAYGSTGTVFSNGSPSVHFSEVQFIDFLGLGGVTDFPDKGGTLDSWVKLRNIGDYGDVGGFPRKSGGAAIFENCFFDEAAGTAIDCKDTDVLRVEGAYQNITVWSGARGFHLDNVKSALFRGARNGMGMGQQLGGNPAIRAINGTTVVLDSFLVTDEGSIQKDASSRIIKKNMVYPVTLI